MEKMYQSNLQDEINNVLQLIKTRNFCECEIDPNYFIFSYNADDDKIDTQDNFKYDFYPNP